MKDVIDALKDKYPYSFSGIHREDGTLKPGPPCKPSEYETLACLANSDCLQRPNNREISRCVIELCQPDSKLSQECLSCNTLVAIDEGNSTSVGIEKCVMSRDNFNQQGLLVLSKKPLSDMEYVPFNPGKVQLIPKGYLRVNVKDVGEVKAVHLTGFYGSSDFFEINVPFLTYDEQNRREINQLLGPACDTNKAIIIGSLNAGPRNPSNSVAGIFEDNFMEFIRKGFVSGYADIVGQCSYCTNNPLTGDWPTNNIIDHVMTKGYKVLNAMRIKTSRPISDHYPIMVTVQV